MNPTTNHCALPKFAVWSVALESVRRISRLLAPFSQPSAPATGSFNAFTGKAISWQSGASKSPLQKKIKFSKENPWQIGQNGYYCLVREIPQ
jgi:hypothetical protein